MNTDTSGAPDTSVLEMAALAAAAVRGLRVREVRSSRGAGTKGTSAVTVDVDGNEWQVYSPNRIMTAEQLNKYVRVLDVLATAHGEGKLPFAVPVPKGVVNRKSGNLVFVFPDLGGEEATEQDVAGARLLASSLAQALAALHNLAPARIASITGKTRTSEDQRASLTALVSQHSAAIPAELRTRWMAALQDDTLWQYQAAPIHGSLAAEDIHIAGGAAVVGIKGFEEAHVADPARDIIWLTYIAGPEFFEEFESAYSRVRATHDLHLLTRAQFLAELETLQWYNAAVGAEDEGWRQDGLVALRDMDVELRGTHLVEPSPEVVSISFSADEEPLLRVKSARRNSGESLEVGTRSTDATAALGGENEELDLELNPATDGSLEISGHVE